MWLPQFIKDMVWRLKPIYLRGEGNVVKLPKHIHRSRIRVYGNNNRVVFADDVLLTNTNIIVFGDNCIVEVAPKVRFMGPCLINVTGGGKILIGENCGIRGVTFQCNEAAIRLGKLVMFSYDILLRNHDSHKVLSADDGKILNSPKDIEIGDHVWVCESAKIMKGVRVGSDSIIALGALVTKDVDTHCIVAGNPGKIVKKNISWDY